MNTYEITIATKGNVTMHIISTFADISAACQFAGEVADMMGDESEKITVELIVG